MPSPTPATTPTAKQAEDAWRTVEIMQGRSLHVEHNGGVWAVVDSRGGRVAEGPDPVSAVMAAESVLDQAEERAKAKDRRAHILAVEANPRVVYVPRVINAGTEEEATVWDVYRSSDLVAALLSLTALGSDFTAWRHAVQAAREAGW